MTGDGGAAASPAVEAVEGQRVPETGRVEHPKPNRDIRPAMPLAKPRYEPRLPLVKQRRGAHPAADFPVKRRGSAVDLPAGAGGDFGGGGATSRDAWGSAGSKHPPTPSPIVSSGGTATTSGASLRPTPTPNDEFRTVVRNGYTYQIDARDRTRHVFGALTIATVPVRSRISQARAGGTERRVSDDGGRYIAARFHGPTEAFNHFAQDANVNRGKYRAMEDEWARDKRAGRTVRVKINPIFDGLSIRPSSIDVLWTVDGIRKSTKLRNDRSEKIRGK